MVRRILAAAVQLAAHERGALPALWPAIARQIGEAAAAGAGLIVLPEGTLPAYVLGYDRFEDSEIRESLDACARLARDHHVVLVVGAARRAGNRVFNSAVAFDVDGSTAGVADKHFLWHFDRQWFAPGERLAPIATSIGSIGALVCADGRIPTIASALVDGGAELLVMPTAWVTSGRDPANLENVQADLLAKVRARENGVPFVAANKCAVELGCVAYCGKSQIVRADGSVAAIASQDRPQTILGEIEIGPGTRRSRENGGIEAAPARRTAPLRIAISLEKSESRAREQTRILEAPVFIGQDGIRPSRNAIGAALVGDAEMLDPAAMAARRLAGFELAVWTTSYEPGWQVTFSRARALELRMYVVTVDVEAGRAYAVDPDGSIVCGTFGEYRTASFTFDPARTAQTEVAPGTDVREGLERARMHAAT